MSFIRKSSAGIPFLIRMLSDYDLGLVLFYFDILFEVLVSTFSLLDELIRLSTFYELSLFLLFMKNDTLDFLGFSYDPGVYVFLITNELLIITDDHRLGAIDYLDFLASYNVYRIYFYSIDIINTNFLYF